MNLESISLVLLFYNEEKIIENITLDSYNFLNNKFDEFEIILVAEGDDSTPVIAEEMGKEYTEVRCISNKEKKGYGLALKTGLTAAKKEYTAYMDGDGQFKIEDLEKMIEKVDTSSMVIGNRKHRKDPYIRKIIGYTFKNFVNFTLPISYKDPECGFKLIKTDIIEEIEINRTHAVDTELLTKAFLNGYKIEEIDLTHYERENGSSRLGGFLGVPIETMTGFLKDVYFIKKEVG